jgi:hypothetical protein
MGLQLRERVTAIVHARHLEVLGFEILDQHLTELPVVVHEQYSGLARPGAVGGIQGGEARHEAFRAFKICQFRGLASW